MIHWPHTTRDWVIAIASGLVGFLFGGAMVAFVQQLLARFL